VSESSDNDDAPTPQRRGRLIQVPTPTPVRLLGRARRAAEDLPIAGAAFRRLRETEDWALAELKHRLDSLGEAAGRVAPERSGADGGSPAQRLARLLHAAQKNDAQRAQELLYQHVLDQMAPEQARIVAVLGDGNPRPLAHVDAGAPVGPVSRRVLSNATSAGQEAGIVHRNDVPRLVTHLMVLGVVEEGPEAKSAKAQYEVLETETCVREAMRYVKDELRQWPRVQRRTLTLTDFGTSLWNDLAPEISGDRATGTGLKRTR